MPRFPLGVTHVAAPQASSLPELVEYWCSGVPFQTGRMPFDVQSRPLRPGLFVCFEQLGQTSAPAFRVAVREQLATSGFDGSRWCC